jgi:hypothetical protein
VLKIFTMSGYLRPAKLWDDINRSKIFSDPERVFKTIYPVIYKSQAVDANPQTVNIEYLYNNLFGQEDLDNGITEEQVTKLFLYQAQNAFARPNRAERSDLVSLEWMKVHKNEFIEAAKVLGLIDRIKPSHNRYDEVWIAGASRPGLMARIIDYKWAVNTYGIEVNGIVKVLAGERELWAEIDGLNPKYREELRVCHAQERDIDTLDIVVSAQADDARVEDGVEHMLDLARKHKIDLVVGREVIKYENKEECPFGRLPGRTYLNYKDPKGLKVTESMMAVDLLEKFGLFAEVVDTKSDGAARPNTATTALDAANQLAQNAQDGKYENNEIVGNAQKSIHVLYQSNNPYIERQGMSTQSKLNKVFIEKKLSGYFVDLDWIGFGNKQDVATISSEFGAFVYESYLLSFGEASTLTYQGRDLMVEVGPMPDLTGIALEGGF